MHDRRLKLPAKFWMMLCAREKVFNRCGLTALKVGFYCKLRSHVKPFSMTKNGRFKMRLERPKVYETLFVNNWSLLVMPVGRDWYVSG